MAAVFDQYSRYYDLLYRDKDYAAEADYVANLLHAHRCPGTSILELGSGTGRHGRLLAERGFHVTGVERSESMLAAARERQVASGDLPNGGSFEAVLGDAGTVRLGRKFDSVASLFHVVSYQASNADLQNVFATAAAHLAPAGLFLFDVWYGPAVLTQSCSVRVKRMRDERCEVLRVAEPVLLPQTNCVNVRYTILIRDLESGEVAELREEHLMRYLFDTEIDLLADVAGFERLHSEEWLTASPPGIASWGVVHVLRRV